MLTPYKPQFIEQIYTDHVGQQFRLVFVVSVVDGKLKGRLVSAVPVAQSSPLTKQSETLCLPISCTQKKTITEYIPAFAPIVSPYNELFFFTSQPTRAPSYN